MGNQQDRQKILQMLAKGTISVEEADQLLSAMNLDRPTDAQPDSPSASGFGAGREASAVKRAQPRYLRVQVEPKPGSRGDRVNIRVPFQLIRAGAKLAAFIPQDARQKVSDSLESKGMSFDLSNLTPENLDTLVDQLSDLSVDVDGGDETVRIFCE